LTAIKRGASTLIGVAFRRWGRRKLPLGVDISKLDFSGRILHPGRFNEEKEGEAGVTVEQILRKHGISRATYYGWKSKYGGATVAELRRPFEKVT